jgi:hypothetical protein
MSEFPIFLDPHVFAETSKKGVPTPRSGLHKIRGMGPSSQKIIEALQPYNGAGRTDPLWMLHELDNADKHRIPNIAASVFKGSTYHIRREDPGLKIQSIRFFTGPVRDGATIGRVVLQKTDPLAKMEIDFTLTYQIAFGERTDHSGQPLPTNRLPLNITTTLIRDAVWTACWRLRRFAGRRAATMVESVPFATS